MLQLIRGAPSAEAARQRLIEQYALDEQQAQAILDMQLRRLAALERQRIEEEYKELTTTIADLQALLADPTRVLGVVTDETRKIKDQYGDARRTAITDEAPTDFTNEELIPHQEMVITMSQRGYITCVPATTSRPQHRAATGVTGHRTRRAAPDPGPHGCQGLEHPGGGRPPTSPCD